MVEALSGEIAAAAGEARTLSIDAVAGLPAVDLALIDALDRIGPYGQGHPEPVFALADVRRFVRHAGEGRACALRAGERAAARSCARIAFRAVKSALGEALMKRKDRCLHVAVKLKRDSYGGTERVECEILDGA